MPNIYFYNDGTQPDAHWDTADNWWSDSGHSTPAGATPADGDSVYLLGTNPPSAAPGTAITLAVFDTSGMLANFEVGSPVVTPAITINSGGTLTVGVAGNASYDHWFGGATASDQTVTAVFQGLGAPVTDISVNTATFADSANQGPCVITANLVTFNSTGYGFYAGSIVGDVVFNALGMSRGTITGNVEFATGLPFSGGTAP